MKIFKHLLFTCVGITSLITADEELATPKVTPYFIDSDSIEALPKLQQLNQTDPGTHKVVFNFENFPENEKITYEIKPLTGRETDTYRPVMTFTVDKNGSITPPEKEPQRYLITSSKGFLPGERVSYRFHNDDYSIDVVTSGIPYPAVSYDRQGNVALRAEILSIDPTVYVIDLPMMKEGENYTLKIITEGTVSTTRTKYNKNKPLHFSPTGRHAGGVSTLKVFRPDSKENYLIKLPWGNFLKLY